MSQFLRASPRCYRVLAAAAVVVLAWSKLAAADDASTTVARPEQGWIHVIPGRCERYVPPRSGTGDPAIDWQQALSLAGCVQDGPTVAFREVEQLERQLEEMTRYLDFPMIIYLQALAEGPAPIQLRAAFHIGLAYVALSTRARSAIEAPPDLATNAEAAARQRVLHARLELLLVQFRRAAWISFATIVEAVAQNPTLAADAVSDHMIRAAREMLTGLRDVDQTRSRRSPYRDR